MSYIPTPDDVRCAACGEWFHKALRACPMCDAPNVPKVAPRASAVPSSAYTAPKPPQAPPAVQPGATQSRDSQVMVPVKHLHVATEITNQYRTLVKWQILGFVVVLDGPILLLFLLFTGFLQPLLGASVLFPVAVGLLPTAGIIGLIHAVFRKPALRQKIAEMGVDATRWADPLEKPLRTFWIVTATFTGAMLALGAILAATASKTERDEASRINQRNSPTVYDWGFQGRR